MLDQATVDAVIFRAIEALNAEREPDRRVEPTSETVLFGSDAVLDSLEFVSVITDVETTLNVDHDVEISLADDRAMSRPVSPYTSVATLRDYVLELVAER
jgi:acyl carrier protein